MKEKAKRRLRLLSLGKYQTTFYNKKESIFMSSVLEGVITLILVLASAAIITDQLVTTVKQSRYNLDLTAMPINAYEE